MMDTKDVHGLESARMTTGWLFRVVNVCIISCKRNSVYDRKKYTPAVFQYGGQQSDVFMQESIYQRALTRLWSSFAKPEVRRGYFSFLITERQSNMHQIPHERGELG